MVNSDSECSHNNSCFKLLTIYIYFRKRFFFWYVVIVWHSFGSSPCSDAVRFGTCITDGLQTYLSPISNDQTTLIKQRCLRCSCVHRIELINHIAWINLFYKIFINKEQYKTQRKPNLNAKIWIYALAKFKLVILNIVNVVVKGCGNASLSMTNAVVNN